MPTKETNSTAAPAATAAASETKNQTAWGAFKGYSPVEISCQHYPQIGGADFSCHSRLRFDAKQIAEHIKAGHGGSFQIKLKPSDKPNPFWDTLAAEDLEKLDFRCEICDAQVPLMPQHINKHMKAHSGKVKRVREGALFNITLSVGAPQTSEDDAFEQFG